MLIINKIRLKFRPIQQHTLFQVSLNPVDQTQQLDNVLQQHGLVAVDLPAEGIGNCFYTAVARQLRMDNISCLAGNIQLTGPAIRQYLIRFLEANKDVWGDISFTFYRRSLESQIFDIRNNEWADNFEIFAVATMFNITIETIDNAGTFIPIYPDRQGNIGQNNVGYLRMVYNNHWAYWTDTLCWCG